MNSSRQPLNRSSSAESKPAARDLSSRILTADFVGESKENYENYLAFMVKKSKIFKHLKQLADKDNQAATEVKEEDPKGQIKNRLQHHITSTILPKIMLKAALRNLNLSIESAKALPHYIEEEAKETQQCAQLFLKDFLSQDDNLQSVINAAYEKQNNAKVIANSLDYSYLFLCQISEQMKIIKTLVRKLKGKEFSENIFVKLKNKQLTLFDHPLFDDLYNQTLQLKEMSHELQQLSGKRMVGESHLKRAYHIIKSCQLSLIDTIAITVEKFNNHEPKEVAESVQQDFLTLFNQIRNIDEYQSIVAKIRAVAEVTRSQAKEITPSCLSFVTTIINDEKHCFVSMSSPDGEINSGLLDKLEIFMKKYGDHEFHLLSSSSKDAQVLIQKALAALGQPHPKSPYRNCAEKSYVSVLTKLIFSFGERVDITGITNISFCPDVHAKNNKTLDVNMGDKVHTFDLMPCCENCKKNKYAVVAILGAAAEYHTHIVKYREALRGIQAIARSDAIENFRDHQSNKDQSKEIVATSPLKGPILSRISSRAVLFAPNVQRQLVIDQTAPSTLNDPLSFKI